MCVCVCVRLCVYTCVCDCVCFLLSQSLEQDKFSLQQKLEAQKATSDTIQQEFEATCAQMEQKYTQQLKYDEEVNSRKVHELTKVNSDLKAENEKLEVSISYSPLFFLLAYTLSCHEIILLDYVRFEDVRIVLLQQSK